MDEARAGIGKDDTASREGRQSHWAFDDSGRRFLEGREDAGFTGASGVLFEQAMAQTRMAVCLSDPNQDDVPIVFANRAFRELTGYEDEEIVGRNCRFLQGPDTDRAAVDRLRTAIAQESVAVVELLNYRKDGSTFWNALHIGPIYGGDGRLMYFFGSQWDVSDVRSARAEEHNARVLTRELSHRMKNMFAVIAGIVAVTGRARGIEREAREITDRIHALGRAYETTLDDVGAGAVDVAEAIRAVLAPYDPDGTRIAVRGEGPRVDTTTVSTIGLAFHELAANAVKHGAFSKEGGTADVVVSRSEDGALVAVWREAGGPAVDGPPGAGGSGLGIVDALLRAAGGTLERSWRPDGLVATLHLPYDAP